MRKAEAAGTEECPVKIKLVAPPLYVLTTQTLNKVRRVLKNYFFFFLCLIILNGCLVNEYTLAVMLVHHFVLI